MCISCILAALLYVDLAYVMGRHTDLILTFTVEILDLDNVKRD